MKAFEKVVVVAVIVGATLAFGIFGSACSVLEGRVGQTKNSGDVLPAASDTNEGREKGRKLIEGQLLEQKALGVPTVAPQPIGGICFNDGECVSGVCAPGNRCADSNKTVRVDVPGSRESALRRCTKNGSDCKMAEEDCCSGVCASPYEGGSETVCVSATLSKQQPGNYCRVDEQCFKSECKLFEGGNGVCCVPPGDSPKAKSNQPGAVKLDNDQWVFPCCVLDRGADGFCAKPNSCEKVGGKCNGRYDCCTEKCDLQAHKCLAKCSSARCSSKVPCCFPMTCGGDGVCVMPPRSAGCKNVSQADLRYDGQKCTSNRQCCHDDCLGGICGGRK